MRLDLNNDATTDVDPDVVMPRDLAEWFVAMLETFPHTERIRGDRSVEESSCKGDGKEGP